MVYIAPLRRSEALAASELMQRFKHELWALRIDRPDAYITDSYPWSAFGAWQAGELVSVLLCSETHSRIEIHLILVDNHYRREGVASLLIDRLVARFNSHKKMCIDAEIPEANLSAQQFFRHKGFLCVQQRNGNYLMRLTRRGAIRASKGIIA
jgi:ribosomal protein S18 acetylase RimI-like enzyme